MTEKLNKTKYLSRLIVVCWIALAICFIIKIFFGNLFDIMCQNENFMAICDYADTHLWLNYLMSALYCFISLYFFTLAILQEIKYERWQLIVVILTVVIGTALKMQMSFISVIFDVWQFFGMPMLFLGKRFRLYWRILLANVLLIVFQLASMYIKNAYTSDFYDSMMIGCIYSLDVLIMVILYYAYCNVKRKEKEENG